VRPVLRRVEKLFREIRTGVKVQKMATAGKKIKVTMEMEGKVREELYDHVLVAVGRVPNTTDLGLENASIVQDEKGFIKVNEKQQTSSPNIYAIGDVVGGVLLAHKASKEARIAVEVITGESSSFEHIVIPAVVFTDPEIAWCGLTEMEAQEKKIAVEVAKFPWSASGRALSFDRTDGMTKLVIDPQTERLLGVGIVGAGAGELISEGVLAIEMGATAQDLAESVHPHPTLSETIAEAAEAFYGYSTHTLPRKRRSH
jgi:dihydrolipoamide dehydrogenase